MGKNDKALSQRDGAWQYRRRQMNVHLRRIQDAIASMVMREEQVDMKAIWNDPRFTTDEKKTILILVVAHYRISNHFKKKRNPPKTTAALLNASLVFDPPAKAELPVPATT